MLKGQLGEMVGEGDTGSNVDKQKPKPVLEENPDRQFYVVWWNSGTGQATDPKPVSKSWQDSPWGGGEGGDHSRPLWLLNSK